MSMKPRIIYKLQMRGSHETTGISCFSLAHTFPNTNDEYLAVQEIEDKLRNII